MAASCFTAGTLITLFDGSKKSIEDVAIGDDLLGGRGSPNRVIQFDHPLLEDRKLYTLNGGDPFVTEEHPFMTKEGWKSINPAATAIENSSLRVETLVIGDILVLESGESTLETLTSSSAAPDVQLYNFKLSGGHTYYADEYLVHNKGAGAGAGTGDASDASDDQGAAAAAAAGQGPPGSDTGAGEMGEGNTGPPGGPGPGSGMDDAGINVSWGKATPSVADTANTENIGINTPEAIASVSRALDAFAQQQQEIDPKPPLPALQELKFNKRNIDKITAIPETKKQREEAKIGLVQKGINDLARNPVPNAVGTFIGSVLAPATFGFSIPFAGTMASLAVGKPEGVAGHNNPGGLGSGTQGTSPASSPSPAGPSDASGGGNENFRRINRAASNNVTLAIQGDDDLTRSQIRRARRQITRFA